MGTAMMLSRLLGSLCLVAAASAAPAAANPSNPVMPYRCEKPSPSFCTNVDWVVSNNSLAENSQNMAEVVLEIAYYSQPGTDECKKKYKDIECALRWDEWGNVLWEVVGRPLVFFSVLRMEAVNEGGTARGVAFGAALQCACTAVCQPLLKSVQCGLVVSITTSMERLD